MANQMMNATQQDEAINRTWMISRTLAGQVATLADTMQVPHSDLVRALLRHALADVASGRLNLHTRPSRWELVNSPPADGYDST